MKIKNVDLKLISWFRRSYLPLARLAIFIVYFYFGLLKLLGESPASPLASALVNKLIGAQFFDLSFTMLAIMECVIGILFLFPKLVRVVIPLLMLHLVVVSLPLVITPELTFSKLFVPTLEGQYIIKNIAVVALAISIAAQVKPLKRV